MDLHLIEGLSSLFGAVALVWLFCRLKRKMRRDT